VRNWATQMYIRLSRQRGTLLAMYVQPPGSVGPLFVSA